VDLYNTASGTWSTAQLSVARGYLAATSVGNVSIFAGGYTGNCSFTLFVEGLLFGFDECGRRCDCYDVCVFRACGLLFVVFAAQEVAVSWGSLQAQIPMLWTCTT
jgi:hypothetical protein